MAQSGTETLLQTEAQGMIDEPSRMPVSTKDRALPGHLERLLRSSLGRLYDDPEGWSMRLVSEQGRPGRERRLVHAWHPGIAQSLAIKANSDAADNRRQYRALCNLRRRTEACVTPLYMAEGARFFVMEWVDAPLLMDRLDGPDRPVDLARVGGWLACLHAATSRHPFLTPKPHVPGVPEGGGVVAEVSAQLGARMRRLPLRAAPTAMLHGDFHPGNLFVTDSRLLAFDRKLDRHGPMFLDIATFLVDLAHLRNLAAEAGRPWAGDPEVDRQSFFEGYGALQERDLALYDLVEDLVVFRRWHRRCLEQKSHRWFQDQMRVRGLLRPEAPVLRPGRLVAGTSGGHWTREPAPVRRFSLVARAVGHLC